jgi:hypothetical protein
VRRVLRASGKAVWTWPPVIAVDESRDTLIHTCRLFSRVRQGIAHRADQSRSLRMYERLGFTATGQQMTGSAGALILHYALDL